MHILLGADAEVREGVVSMICLGEMYCRCGIPMLKTRIQLPALSDGQPAEWMRSLATLTQRYAEQTLVPAVCEVYEGLPSVAEKMHFEPFEYRHVWHTQPHPGASDLLTVHIETVLVHGRRELSRTVIPITVHAANGRIVRSRGTRMRGAAPNPAKETFCKKFLWNLQKPSGQKMNEAFSCPIKGNFP